jgi:hypothetical protein
LRTGKARWTQNSLKAAKGSVVECLPSICENVGSIPAPKNQNKTNKKTGGQERGIKLRKGGLE